MGGTPSTQPGVNPGGGAAPVQPNPLPYAAMASRFVMPAPVAAAATGTGGRSLSIDKVDIVLGDIGRHSGNDVKRMVVEAMLEVEQRLANA